MSPLLLKELTIIFLFDGHIGHVTEKPRTNFRSLVLIGKAVSEKKMIVIVTVRRRLRTTDGRTDAGTWVYYKLTFETSAQVS